MAVDMTTAIAIVAAVLLVVGLLAAAYGHYVANKACPVCGSLHRTEVAPGVYRCDHCERKRGKS